jgi:hypothetical protein
MKTAQSWTTMTTPPSRNKSAWILDSASTIKVRGQVTAFCHTFLLKIFSTNSSVHCPSDDFFFSQQVEPRRHILFCRSP